MDTAVSWESPVIILMATPELISMPTASLTPDLGGSMMPTRPRKVRLPISAPEANARTAGRDGHTIRAPLSEKTLLSHWVGVFYLLSRRCPCI